MNKSSTENRKKDRHKPGYIRPDRRKSYTGVRGRPRKDVPIDSVSSTHVSKESMFISWEDFLTRTTERERMDWCKAKARKANRKRLLSGEPMVKLTAIDVWEVLESYKGHCRYCGSLALENRPSKPNGAPFPWEHIGRRIGSLEHIESRFDGGENEKRNLAWS